MKTATPEQRRATRTRKSEAMLWRRLGKHDFDMAWLLETSPIGAAFAWRGDRFPLPGALLEVHLDPTDTRARPARAVVRRASRAHDDLVVIGAEIIHSRPFPPSAESAETHSEEPEDLALFLAA